MKKILFFTHSLVGGGAEKTIINLSEYMNENIQDVESHICVVYDDPEVRRTLKNVHVLSYKTTPQMNKLRKIPIILRQAIELRKLKKKLGIDTCISFLPGADFLNVLSGQGEKRISSVRNKESFFATSWLKRQYVKFGYAGCDKIVAISKRVKEDIVTNFGVNESKVEVIYNPIMRLTFGGDLLDSFLQVAENNHIIINVGRLTQQKGQGYLIRAFQNVVEDIKNAHLVILGQGELEVPLKQLAIELGIEENVHFLGFVRNPQDYIKAADIFVFPSIVEGLGNVLLETLSCETPIISADCDCGPREILAPETLMIKPIEAIEWAEYGVLVPVCTGDYLTTDTKLSREENILAQSIKALLVDRETREKYKKAGLERTKDFDMSIIISEWMKLFA